MPGPQWVGQAGQVDCGARGRCQRCAPEELLRQVSDGVQRAVPPGDDRQEGPADPPDREIGFVPGMGAHQGRGPGPAQDAILQFPARERGVAALEELDHARYTAPVLNPGLDSVGCRCCGDQGTAN